MLLDEERAEAAYPRQVGGRRAPNDWETRCHARASFAAAVLSHAVKSVSILEST
jgi:hypothetical protein